MQISSSNSQNANLNETWTIIPHLSNEKHLNHVWRCNSPFSSLFQRPNQLSKPLLSYGEVYFLLQHQCFNVLPIIHHKIANLVSRCKILSPIRRQWWENDIQEIVSSIHGVPISLFHWQIRMMQIYPISTIDGVLDLSRDISHFKTIQSDWWNHNHVAHIITTSNSLSSIHFTPKQGYHWLELKSKPENFSNLSEASFLDPSRNGITRLMPNMIQFFSCRCEPRVWNIRHGKPTVQNFPQKLWASHMYVQIWHESQRLEKKGTTSFKTTLKSNPLLHLQPFAKTHFLFSLPTWNPDEMILETYAPESSCQSQIICKDLQHSSRSWTRRGGHSRSRHTRWSGRHTRWSGQIGGGP